MMWKRTIASTVVLGLALPLLPAQEASRASLPEFHEVHVNTIEIECTDCHALPDDPAPGMELSFTVRPGHDQCNICHEDEFDEGEFIALCLTCHTNDFFELGNFPSGNDSIGDFSHERHVDPRGRVDRVSGQRLDCVFCHQVAGDGGAGLPSHPQYKDCHAGSGAAPPVISPDDNQACLGCHALARIDYTIKHRPGEMEAAGMLPAWLKAKLLDFCNQELAKRKLHRQVQSYDDLLNKKLQANVSQNLEERARGALGGVQGRPRRSTLRRPALPAAAVQRAPGRLVAARRTAGGALLLALARARDLVLRRKRAH